MPSKPLAYFLLILACMAAAGAGAFIAIYQPSRAVSSTAPQSVGAAVQGSPQQVGVEPQATTSAARPALVSKTTAPPKPTSSPAAGGERRAGAVPVAGVKSHDSPSQPAAPAPPSRVPANPQPDVVQAGPPPVPVAPMGQGGVDPNPQSQRPWPATPWSPPLFEPPPAASGAVAGQGGVETSALPEMRLGQWLEVMVPAETVIGLQLDSTINTEYARIEDPVDARVTRDVRVGGHLVIPAGTQAIGSVTVVERGGPVKTRARIGFRFHTLVFADKSRVSISTDAVYRVGESPGDRSSAKIGGAAIGGAIIGAILGGGKGAAIGSGIGAAGGAAAAMRGDRLPVVVPAGTTLSVRTLAPVGLPIER
jgi:hypothetical protein